MPSPPAPDSSSSLRLEEVRLTFRPGRSLGQDLAARLARLAGRPARPEGIQAVRGVSLALRPGETLGLVGESGSGKSTLGRLMAGLYRPDSGRVLWQGRDLAAFNRSELRLFRRRAQIMFQDPVSALNPRFTAADSVGEGLVIHGLGRPAERRERTAALLREVGLPPEAGGRFGHEFSGGQRQRLNLARALALDPEILIADEPVSALDVSIQAQVVNLLLDLKAGRGLTLVMISHDLPLIRIMADRVAVMYGGLLMEVAAAGERGRRRHPYVETLWAAADGGRYYDGPSQTEGEPPDPARPPEGCPFHPRCPEAGSDCRELTPPLRELEPGFACACHRRS